MPYYIAKDREGCKAGWAVIDQAGAMFGCHTTKQGAIDQAVAISISTKEPFEGERGNRALPDELSVGDYVAWVIQTTELESYAGVITEMVGTEAKISVWDDEEEIWFDTKLIAVVPISELKKIEPLPTADTPATLGDVVDLIEEVKPMDAQRAKWVNAAWAIKAKLEGLSDEARSLGKNEVRTGHTKIEVREDGDGLTFSGYAAVFNSDSQPLPFIERIAPGAFKRSLQSRNEIKLLWNHDAGEPLASVRGGTLRLTEDDRGLRVEAKMANTTRGRDVAELIRSGTVDSMSFGFSTISDSWSSDGSTRTLNAVRLFEVSIVSSPAYEATAGTLAVRSAQTIDADQLAEALFKLESGEELDPTAASLVTDVVAKLTKTEEVQQVEGDILALKKKKLDLLLKEATNAN